MSGDTTRSWLEIHVNEVAHNVNEIRKLIPKHTDIIGIVKANAYGHGAVEMSEALQDCNVHFFAVSNIDEAVELRDGGIEDPILILGYTPPVHMSLLTKYNLIQTVYSKEYMESLVAYTTNANVTVDVHIKVDTGMSRIGFVAHEDDYHIEDILSVFTQDSIRVKGIFSHFSVADELDEDNLAFTTKQIEMFDKVLDDIKTAGYSYGVTHISNSYGIVNYPDLPYDYVRPGLLYLGVTSNDKISINTSPNFHPIMEWKTNVSMVKEITKGTSVSYGRNYRAPSKRKIASLSVGYADGYPRSISNLGMEVLIHGKRVPIVGNICMDQMMIDVSEIEDVKQGDEVVLIGVSGEEEIRVDEITRAAKTINNETFVWITNRVSRVYDGGK